MASSSPTQVADVSDTFGTLIENVQLLVNQIKDEKNPRKKDPNFSLDSFWQRFGKTFKAVSMEATKLCMAFSQPPTPTADEFQPLISGIEKSTLSMFSAFYSLPLSQGEVLHRHTQTAVLDVLCAVRSLTEVIRTEGHHGESHQLQSTGSVWDLCDSFPTLPRNNKEAVLMEARESLGLVKDALEEIEEAAADDATNDQNGDSSNENDSWPDEDRKLLTANIGLLKTVKNSLRKVTVAVRDGGGCSSEAEIVELDELAPILRGISPAVDELTLSLYPPMQWSAVQENAQTLADLLHQLLQKSKHIHITTEDDVKWVEFLIKATSHNHGKVKELITPQ